MSLAINHKHRLDRPQQVGPLERDVRRQRDTHQFDGGERGPVVSGRPALEQPRQRGATLAQHELIAVSVIAVVSSNTLTLPRGGGRCLTREGDERTPEPVGMQSTVGGRSTSA